MYFRFSCINCTILVSCQCAISYFQISANVYVLLELLLIYMNLKSQRKLHFYYVHFLWTYIILILFIHYYSVYSVSEITFIFVCSLNLSLL